MLEYARLLIETEGWNNLSQSGQESSASTGWTLHDSIGEACRRLSAFGQPPGSRRGGSKDAVYERQTPTGPVSVTLRTDAQNAVDAELQRMADAGEWTNPGTAARIDYAYNDQATGQQQIIDVLNRAREAV